MDEHTILVSIVTSLIASVVFWIVFSLIPTTIKYFQIRPRVETDITDIKLHLLFFIQIPFLQSIHATSVFQADMTRQEYVLVGKQPFAISRVMVLLRILASMVSFSRSRNKATRLLTRQERSGI